MKFCLSKQELKTINFYSSSLLPRFLAVLAVMLHKFFPKLTHDFERNEWKLIVSFGDQFFIRSLKHFVEKDQQIETCVTWKWSDIFQNMNDKHLKSNGEELSTKVEVEKKILNKNKCRWTLCKMFPFSIPFTCPYFHPHEPLNRRCCCLFRFIFNAFLTARKIESQNRIQKSTKNKNKNMRTTKQK